MLTTSTCWPKSCLTESQDIHIHPEHVTVWICLVRNSSEMSLWIQVFCPVTVIVRHIQALYFTLYKQALPFSHRRLKGTFPKLSISLYLTKAESQGSDKQESSVLALSFQSFIDLWCEQHRVFIVHTIFSFKIANINESCNKRKEVSTKFWIQFLAHSISYQNIV